jgi:hypothetical protein
MKLAKLIKTFLIIICALTVIALILGRGPVYKAEDLSYGTTFSVKHAKWLVGDKWRDNYLSMLDDLKVNKIRVPAYWDEIQKSDYEHFDYSDLDWMMEEAGKRDARIIMAVGYRLPRWPECHLPDWAKSLDIADMQKQTLAYLKNTIERYKDKPQISAWQIENEPFLRLFGQCPEFDTDFLDKEIALVKSLDNRPIVVTDSGELSLWIHAAARADTFGTSLYLNTYSQATRSYIHYPIGPSFFHFKKNLAALFANPKKWIVIEMQAEPWGPISYVEMSEKEKSRTMDIDKFRQILEFGRRAGFQEFYLWGVEWWYWEKEVKNNPIYWDEARKVFSERK